MVDEAYEVEPAEEVAPAEVEVSTNCVRCGYDLKGLARTGTCPECGTIVERSLMGDNLVYSSPEYVAKLQRGLSFILNAILMMVINMVLAGVSGAAGLPTLALVSSFIGIGISLALVVGWWLFSEEDPAYIGTDNGSKSRRVVRVMVVIELITALASTAYWLVPPSTSVTSAAAVLGGVIGLASLVVSAVKFFAAMLYVRWISGRIPSEYVHRRAGLLMWLCPVLVTVGSLILVGPLIALILYWNLLNRVRAEIKTIRERQSRFVW